MNALTNFLKEKAENNKIKTEKKNYVFRNLLFNKCQCFKSY